jgi:hypothetical protein
MAYQCTHCGEISHSEKKPYASSFGKCTKNPSTMHPGHSWTQVNVGGGSSSGGSSNSSSSETGNNRKSGEGIGKFMNDAMKSDEEKMAEAGLSGEEIATINAQKHRAELEQEKLNAQERIEHAKIDLEKEKLKAEKAEKLRAEGKNIQAFILLHRGWSIAILIITLLIGLMIFGNIKAKMKETALQESISKCEDLEKIESQIILGINNGDKKEILLELVDKLKHNDATNYIEGKKMGIIKDTYYNDPEHEFLGKYSEYWTAKREAYKEIITKGLTIEEYMKSAALKSQEISSNKEVKDSMATSNEETPSTSDINNELMGEWKGDFGNDQLLINIERINEDGSVAGFNIVKNNKRALTGVKNGDEFELKEPGDDKWDGVFKFTITDNIAKGTWTANNGKSTKQFSLSK